MYISLDIVGLKLKEYRRDRLAAEYQLCRSGEGYARILYQKAGMLFQALARFHILVFPVPRTVIL